MRVNPNSLLAVLVGFTLNFGLSGTAQATTWSYDFNGTLSDHFSQVADSPAPSTSGQVAGQFIYHTLGQQYTAINPMTGLPETAGSNELYSHNTFSPRFDQSWDMQITATVPSGLEATLPNAPLGSDWFMEIGFSAVFFNTSGDMYTFSNFLGIGSAGDRRYNGEYGIARAGGDWTEYLENQGNHDTLDETGMLGMKFDATNKVLTAYNTHQTLMSIDLDAPGVSQWGMNDSDQFIIFLGGSGEGWAIPQSMALSLDNFSATAQPVPEAETYAMMLAGLGLVGFMARRRKQAVCGHHK